MKKTILTILFCGGMVLGLTGCNNSNEKETLNSNDAIHSFQGTIVECEQKAMIVKPDETEEEYKSSDKFRVEYVDGFDTCNIGTKVKVTYEGGINEIYPAQIGTIGIEIVENESAKNILMTIKENSLTDSGIILIVKNNSEQKYYYGPEYYLEKYENGTFKTYESKEILSWNSVLYNIEVNEEKEVVIDWSYGYGKLNSGKYRLVKKFTADENMLSSSNVPEKFYVEFEIK